MIITLVDEAVAAGARRKRACELLGLAVRTLERWADGGEDGRHGPKRVPANRLSEAERRRVVAIATSPEFRDLSPKQIVPRLADRGDYVASESTFYRVLHEADLQRHRGPSRPPTSRPRQHAATGPWQLASWDITYLCSGVRGQYFYLYLVEDIWSRKILGWAIHTTECGSHAAELVSTIADTARAQGIDLAGWVLHSDNGGPMKGSTMLATLQRLGVVPSFSRPRVSDDNPFSEALFKTLKYCPEYPRAGFATVDAARAWTARFVAWYNDAHLHSGIGHVTPASRHDGRDVAILAARRETYQRARDRRPDRWAGNTRPWERPATVLLNPELGDALAAAARRAA
jgi:putative transposase